MSPGLEISYNRIMTTTKNASSGSTRSLRPRPAGPPAPRAVPRHSGADTLLEGLAAQDFDHLASALRSDVHMRALLPPGDFQWNSAEEVRAAFAMWFGDVDELQFVEGTVGQVGPRLHLHWRLRVRAERLGDGWFVVEQQAFADTDEASRIHHLSLLCSGYCPERA